MGADTNQCRICGWMCALGPCTIYKMPSEKKRNFLSPSLFLSLFLLPSRLQRILKSKQLFRREPETRLEVSFLKRQEERGDGSLGTDSKHFFFKCSSIPSLGSGDAWGTGVNMVHLWDNFWRESCMARTAIFALSGRSGVTFRKAN